MATTTSDASRLRAHVQRWTRRSVMLVVLAATAFSLSGCQLRAIVVWILCANTSDPDMCLQENAFTKRGSDGPKPVKADDFSFFGQPGAGEVNVGRRRLPVDLLPPFRIEVSTGLCDPEFYPDTQTTFGLRIVHEDEIGMSTPGHSIFCNRTAGPGMDVTPTLDADGPTQPFTDVEQVEIAIEHNGQDLIAFTRKTDDGAVWQEIQRIDATDLDGPYYPSLEVYNLGEGKMISFFAFRIVANGEFAPGTATPEREALKCTAMALSELGEGFAELDSPNPDVNAVLGCLQRADEHIEASRAALQGARKAARAKAKTFEEKQIIKADKSARKAGSKTAKAIKLLEKKGAKKATAAVKQVVKSGTQLLKSGDRILTDDLRELVQDASISEYLLGK